VVIFAGLLVVMFMVEFVIRFEVKRGPEVKFVIIFMAICSVIFMVEFKDKMAPEVSVVV
jgi:hypothetical protein